MDTDEHGFFEESLDFFSAILPSIGLSCSVDAFSSRRAYRTHAANPINHESDARRIPVCVGDEKCSGQTPRVPVDVKEKGERLNPFAC
jgi:hypothetical protein